MLKAFEYIVYYRVDKVESKAKKVVIVGYEVGVIGLIICTLINSL